jgi:hypothetical protein
MLENTRNTRSIDDSIQNASADVKVLVKDAQALLTAAASLTGVKADELRSRGMELLDRAKVKRSSRARNWPRPPMSTLKITHGAPSLPQRASACWLVSTSVVNNPRRR